MSKEIDFSQFAPPGEVDFDAFDKPEDKPWTSDLAEVGKQAVAGLAVEVPKQVGQAMKWTSEPGKPVYQAGQSVTDWAAKQDEGWAKPDMEGRGPVASTLIESARQVAPSLATAGAVTGLAAAAPVVGLPALGAGAAAGLGAAATGAMFGMSQAQDTYERVKAAGGSDEEARKAGWASGLIEGAGESVANLAEMKLLGAGGKAIAGKMLETETLKPFAKQYLQTLGTEMATEAGQSGGEAAVEKAYGVDTNPLAEAGHGARVAAGMTTLLAPFGLGAHAAQAQGNKARIANEGPGGPGFVGPPIPPTALAPSPTEIPPLAGQEPSQGIQAPGAIAEQQAEAAQPTTPPVAPQVGMQFTHPQRPETFTVSRVDPKTGSTVLEYSDGKKTKTLPVNNLFDQGFVPVPTAEELAQELPPPPNVNPETGEILRPEVLPRSQQTGLALQKKSEPVAPPPPQPNSPLSNAINSAPDAVVHMQQQKADEAAAEQAARQPKTLGEKKAQLQAGQAPEAPQPAITPSAQSLLDTVEQGGVPTAMTLGLRKIASENGIEVTGDTTPNDVIGALWDKQAAAEETKAPLSGAVQQPQEAIQNAESNGIENTPLVANRNTVSPPLMGQGGVLEGTPGAPESGSQISQMASGQPEVAPSGEVGAVGVENAQTNEPEEPAGPMALSPVQQQDQGAGDEMAEAGGEPQARAQGQAVEPAAVEGAVEQDKTPEPWTISRSDFIDRAQNAFVHQQGKRRLFVQWNNRIYNIPEQKNGKLTASISDVLGRIHKRIVDEQALLQKNDAFDVENAPAPGLRDMARGRIESRDQYPTEAALSEYIDQAQVTTQPQEPATHGIETTPVDQERPEANAQQAEAETVNAYATNADEEGQRQELLTVPASPQAYSESNAQTVGATPTEDLSRTEAAAPEAQAKAPWEMTQEEFITRHKTIDSAWQKDKSKPSAASFGAFYGDDYQRYLHPSDFRKGNYEGTYEQQKHHSEIRNALSEGKPVPAEVLADYPDLQTQQPAGAPETTQSPYRFEDAPKNTFHIIGNADEAQSRLKAAGLPEGTRVDDNTVRLNQLMRERVEVALAGQGPAPAEPAYPNQAGEYPERAEQALPDWIPEAHKPYVAGALADSETHDFEGFARRVKQQLANTDTPLTGERLRDLRSAWDSRVTTEKAQEAQAVLHPATQRLQDALRMREGEPDTAPAPSMDELLAPAQAAEPAKAPAEETPASPLGSKREQMRAERVQVVTAPTRGAPAWVADNYKPFLLDQARTAQNEESFMKQASLLLTKKRIDEGAEKGGLSDEQRADLRGMWENRNAPVQDVSEAQQTTGNEDLLRQNKISIQDYFDRNSVDGEDFSLIHTAEAAKSKTSYGSLINDIASAMRKMKGSPERVMAYDLLLGDLSKNFEHPFRNTYATKFPLGIVRRFSKRADEVPIGANAKKELMDAEAAERAEAAIKFVQERKATPTVPSEAQQIESAAHETATSPLNDLAEPTEAQKPQWPEQIQNPQTRDDRLARRKYRALELTQARVDRLRGEADRLGEASKQVPGAFETGRSGYTLGKKRDAMNNRLSSNFAELQKNEQRLQELNTWRAAYEAGEVHANGQPKTNAPSRQAEQSAADLYADYIRAKVKKGDAVTFIPNPNNGARKVTRLSGKSVTLDSGTRWSYQDIAPMRDGRNMTPDEMKEDIRAWKQERDAAQAPQPINAQQETANAIEIPETAQVHADSLTQSGVRGEGGNPAVGSGGVLRGGQEAEKQSAPIETKVEPNPFATHDAVAREYGRQVNPDGTIITSSGEDSGLRVSVKKGRMRVEDKDSGNLYFSGSGPNDIGHFLEKFWYAEKLPQAAISVASAEQTTPTEQAGEVAQEKEPWEMTSEDYWSTRPSTLVEQDIEAADPEKAAWYRERPHMDARTANNDKHKTVISHALSEGKPVPADVLADYPELVAKQKQDEGLLQYFKQSAETKATQDATEDTIGWDAATLEQREAMIVNAGWTAGKDNHISQTGRKMARRPWAETPGLIRQKIIQKQTRHPASPLAETVAESSAEERTGAVATTKSDILTLPDGRKFPTIDGANALSWSIEGNMTAADEEAGYPKTRAVIRAMAQDRPDDLRQRQEEAQRYSDDAIFGHTARTISNLISDEFSKLPTPSSSAEKPSLTQATDEDALPEQAAINTLDDLAAIQRASDDRRRNRIEKRVKEREDSGLVHSNAGWHAPAGGWTDGIGRTYAPGEFVSIEDMPEPVRQVWINIHKDDVNDVKAMFPGADISEKYGQARAGIWLSPGVARQAEKLLPDLKAPKTIMTPEEAAAQGKTLGKTWKMPSLKQVILRKTGVPLSELMRERPNEPTWTEGTALKYLQEDYPGIKSEHFGKEVGFAYGEPTVLRPKSKSASTAATETVAPPPAVAKESVAPSRTINTIEAHKSAIADLKEGRSTPESLRADYESFTQNRSAIEAELNKLKKPELLKRAWGASSSDNKASLVRRILSGMEQQYVPGDSLQYDPFKKNGREEAIRKALDSATPESLAAYAEKVSQRRTETMERTKSMLKAVQNPETLDEFKQFIQYRKGGKDAFTPEQRDRYEELVAAEGRATAEKERAAKATVGGVKANTESEIIETTHTKKGHALFVVRLADRVERDVYNNLNAAAKRLGGYYSSFRGPGAVPGFQFKSRAEAEQFQAILRGESVDRSAAVEEKVQQSQSKAAERLIGLADKLEEKANEALGRERKTNTARRARMANHADDAARKDVALAKTMRNIAEAMQSGEVNFLDGIRHRADVEYLNGLVDQAKSEEIRKTSQGYGEQEKRKGEPATAETARYAEYPKYVGWADDLKSAAQKLQDKPGAKLVANQLLKFVEEAENAEYIKAVQASPRAFNSMARKENGKIVDVATFGTEEEAKAVTRRASGGKDVSNYPIVRIDRGQYIVAAPRQAAIEQGKFQPSGKSDRVTLPPDLAEVLISKAQDANISIGSYLPSIYSSRQRLAGLGITSTEQLRSALREFITYRSERPKADRAVELERALAGNKNVGIDWYPTPPNVAADMVERAGVQEGMRALEPSAGNGNIAEALRDAGAQVDVVEVSSTLREILEAKKFNLVGRDFMEYGPRAFGLSKNEFAHETRVTRIAESLAQVVPKYANGPVQGMETHAYPTGIGGEELTNRQIQDSVFEKIAIAPQYDAIVMNPPFSNNQDIQHVQHAYSLLKPGGKLVAIVGEGAFFRTGKTETAFREWLGEVGASVEKLPEGTFQDKSMLNATGANARLVEIEKPSGEEVLGGEAETRPAPITPTERTQARQAARTDRTVDPNKDSILTAIAKRGGVSMEEARRQGIDPAYFGVRGHKIYRVFTKNGMTFDDMAHNILGPDGYPVTGANDLLEAIEKELAGQKVRTPEGDMQAMEREYAGAEDPHGDPGFMLDESEYHSDADAYGRRIEELSALADRMQEGAGEAIVERAAIQETSDEETIRQLEQWIADKNRAGVDQGKQGARAQAGVQEDAFGRNETAQAVHEARLKKDQQRNGGKGDVVEAGALGGLWSNEEKQVDVEDLTGKGPAITEQGANYEARETDASDLSPAEGRDVERAAQREGSEAARGDVHAAGGVRLSSKVVQTQTGQLTTGFPTITTWGEAAHTVAQLRKFPQEHFLALVLDKDGKPLAALRHTIGLPNKADVAPSIVAGSIYAIPGAKEVILAHNHPSGSTQLSVADNVITDTLADLMRGTGIEVRGMLAIARDKFSVRDTRGSVPERKNQNDQSITPARRQSTIPILERIYRKQGRLMDAAIETPSLAVSVARTLLGERSGLLLLDNAHYPLGAIPLSPAEATTLRGENGPAARILQAVHESNASAAIMAIDSWMPWDAARNVGTLLSQAGVRFNDIVNSQNGESLASIGADIKNPGAYFSRSYSAVLREEAHDTHHPATLRFALQRALRPLGRGLYDNLMAQPWFHIVTSEDMPGVPAEAKNSGMHGYYNPKTHQAYLVADNIEAITSDEDLRGLVLHEIGVHAMQLGRDSKEFKAILKAFDDMAMAGDKAAGDAFMRAMQVGTPSKALQEEALAYFIEAHPDLSFTKRVIAWFRQVLRDLGEGVGLIPKRWAAWANTLSHEDLVYMAQSALRQSVAKPSMGVLAPFAVVQYAGGKLGEWAMRGGGEVKLPPGEFLPPIPADGKGIHDVLFSADIDRQASEVIPIRDSEGRLLAPNGKPSKLNEMQWRQVRTPEFKAWFGDWENDPENASKVVDENGEPLVVFHKSTADIYAFDPQFIGKHDSGYAGSGFYFIDIPLNGLTYGNTTYPVFLNIKNPYVRNAENWQQDKFNPYIFIGESGRTAKEWTAAAIKKGYDGFLDKAVDNGEIVVFSPTQIKSAIGNTGAFDPENADIRYSKGTPTEQAVEDWKSYGRPAGAWLGIFTRDMIVDMHKDDMPQLKTYQKHSKAWEAIRNKHAIEADRYVKHWKKTLTAAEQDALSDVALEATIQQYDPDRLRPENEEQALLKQQFDALPDKTKAVYREVRDMYRSRLLEVRNALVQRVKETVEDAGIQQELVDRIMNDFDDIEMKGPYFPLPRFGRYVVIGRVLDEEGKENIAAREVQNYESEKEARAAAKTLRDGGYTVQMTTKDQYDRNSEQSKAVAKIVRTARDAIDAAKGESQIDAETLDQMEDTIRQTLIEALPDLSYRKSFTHRKNRRGFSKDMQRAFAERMYRSSNLLASLQTQHKIQQAINAMQTDIKGNISQDVSALHDVVNELVKREQSLATYRPNAFAQLAQGIGFNMALGANMASATINLLQTPLVAIPYNAARYGLGKTLKEFGRAAALLQHRNLYSVDGFDLEKFEGLSEREREMVLKLRDSGQLNYTLTHDLIDAAYPPGADTGIAGKASQKMQTLGKWSALPFHIGETMNREVTALATYRLAFADAKSKGMDEDTAHQTAIQAASDANDATHFDYQQQNRSRLMMGNTARVLTQFKQYSLNMAYLIGRNAYQAVRGKTSEERLVAAKTLGYMMGGAFATAGLMGLPISYEAAAIAGGVAGFQKGGQIGAGAGAITGLMLANALVAGVEDDDDDFAMMVRHGFAEAFGVKGGEALTRGPMRMIPWLGDIDLASRTSMNQMFVRPPDRELEGADLFHQWTETLLGPFVGQIGNWFDAKKLFDDGHPERAMETIMPNVLKSGMRSVRYATEGAKTMKEEPLLERELTPWEYMVQFMGFTPSRLAERQQANTAVKNAEVRLDRMRERLINERIDAIGDEIPKVQAKIQRFNSEHPTHAINGRSLAQSRRARALASRQTEGGLRLSRKHAALRDLGDWADTE